MTSTAKFIPEFHTTMPIRSQKVIRNKYQLKPQNLRFKSIKTHNFINLKQSFINILEENPTDIYYIPSNIKDFNSYHLTPQRAILSA